MADLASTLQPLAERLLGPGETLAGCCVATQQSMFKGRMVAIVVTEGRLIVQGLDRKFEPDGDPLELTPERIAKAGTEGGGGEWGTLESALMDRASVTLKLRTTDGEKLKLMMMRGEGPLGLGKLGGGEIQRDGVRAIGEWFERHAVAG